MESILVALITCGLSLIGVVISNISSNRRVEANLKTAQAVTDTKLEELTRIQVDAIANLKIDKITVWDNGSSSPDGKNATANFVSGLMKSVPPMQEIFDMAGMKLPEYLGTEKPVVEAHDVEDVAK
mgnify:CR=1 FL=1